MIRTIKYNTLRNRKLRVPRPGRQVEHQDIETAPVDLKEELLKCLHDHETSPCNGSRLADEVAHRHSFDTVVCEWEELIVWPTVSLGCFFAAQLSGWNQGQSHFLRDEVRPPS